MEKKKITAATGVLLIFLFLTNQNEGINNIHMLRKYKTYVEEFPAHHKIHEKYILSIYHVYVDVTGDYCIVNRNTLNAC